MADMGVKCAAQQQETEPVETSSPTPTPVAPPKASPKIIELLEFRSPVPERINGRLAMLGFVSAIGAEVLSGQDVFSQISHGGFQLFLGATILFSIASFVPLLKGVDPESKSEGLMSSDAELLNGRLAMLGLVTLVVTEFAKGGALV
uniref:Early light-induced protein n=1 Tax=Kalanchoe fedtschenkoi TaxID=63787 RepID=A0A7N0VLX5_KALFE